ncbi:hypothetical protein ACFL2A_05280, partial [Thermodesulfobacteriota bacterium]
MYDIKNEDISSIKTIDYVTDNKRENKALIFHLRDEFKIRLNVIDTLEGVENILTDRDSDMILLDQECCGDPGAGIKICMSLRESGNDGIIVLCSRQEKSDEISNSVVTSIGFDNFIPINASLVTILNQIHWAILNRRRKNKNVLFFDNNPDSICTVDKKGVIYDINDPATVNCEYTPKEIVTQKINIKDVNILPTFNKDIKPFILKKNVGHTFEHTSDEKGVLSQ